MIYDDTYDRIIISKGDIFSLAKKRYNREGFWSLVRISFSFIKELFLVTIPNYICFLYYKLFKSSETFEFQGKRFHYFFHPYCTTWRNERTVAVPIIWDTVKQYEGKKKNILEVGNVLSYYFNVSHDVLDKYEIMDGVMNEDVVDFKPTRKYDLIVSIVTIGHVGWNESPKDPTKFIRAIENLKRILSVSGQLVVVMGLGINPSFDSSLESKTTEFNKQGYLRHLRGYIWQEAKREEINDLKYDELVPTANAVVIGEINHESNGHR